MQRHCCSTSRLLLSSHTATDMTNKERSRLQELESYLAEGVSLDELWQVAKGQKKYADFARQRKEGDAAPQPPPPEKEVELPDDVVSLALTLSSFVSQVAFCYLLACSNCSCAAIWLHG